MVLKLWGAQILTELPGKIGHPTCQCRNFARTATTRPCSPTARAQAQGLDTQRISGSSVLSTTSTPAHSILESFSFVPLLLSQVDQLDLPDLSLFASALLDLYINSNPASRWCEYNDDLFDEFDEFNDLLDDFNEEAAILFLQIEKELVRASKMRSKPWNSKERLHSAKYPPNPRYMTKRR
ncbi:hypothetical protein BDZ97DRAFT_1918286 [Flammula alnicola]|nr:hypothetical protein BDZ97DRAFT_1918286 [Flammula alnicola]